ncbi:hypothetical protein G3I60_33325 [Streptomyces sp. SID13666]|uniref:hypothetical protein n=1 Tax=unclassified Streptomyces TaxID=2593676 RepID=UPI0013C1DDC3|nr:MULTISPECIES: hypothetical protein [unclassified Streptomyces]NEA58908.1 hypothetical protein [Streptomyces sp. SID13666]NEA72968.1 hypothetical protein [Streptomyces sp. SID13588]
MTENRRCDGHRDDDWLDEDAAERLLRGESVMSGGAGAARLARLLAAAAAPAAADPEREEAAVAAFLTSFDAAPKAGPRDGSGAGPEQGSGDADFLSVVRLGRPVTAPGTALTARAGRLGAPPAEGRGKVAGAPKSLKASVGALVVAMALCAAVLAASPGILPLPFDADNVGSAPVRSGAPSSATPDGSGTAGPDGGSSPLTGGTADAPHGKGASSEPGHGATPSPGRPASPANPSATPPPSAHSLAPQGTHGERDRQNVELCRAYIKAGGRLDGASSDRLVAAAGSKRDVPKYCARVLAAAYVAGSGGAGNADGGKSGGTSGGHTKGDGRND